jgi:endonuclease YncB( thermonuclease family)
MANGLLEVHGHIDLAQIWPEGNSDADTLKVVINEKAGAFRFRAGPKEKFQVTHVFSKVKIKGRRITSPILLDRKTGRPQIVIRLQGIDAPELHFIAQSLIKGKKLNGKDFRQPFGKTSSLQLAKFLKRFGESPLPCRVITAVDYPNEVFDVYGRFVGDILIDQNGKSHNVNQYLVSAGWAFPAFYNSMSRQEILDLSDLAVQAQNGGKGMWPQVSKHIEPFDWNRVLNKALPQGKDDSGPVNFPKIFRRQTTYEVNKQAGNLSGTFLQYLAEQKNPDLYYEAQEFLGEDHHSLTSKRFEGLIDKTGRLKFNPKDIVFKEQYSGLVGPTAPLGRW